MNETRNIKSVGEVIDLSGLKMFQEPKPEEEAIMAKQRAEYQERLAKEEELRKSAMLTNGGFGPREIKAAKVYIHTKMDVIMEKVRNNGVVLLNGPCGTGKTVASCRVAMELDVPFRYVRFLTLIRELKATWSRSAGTTELEVIARYAKTGLLIVDEFQDGTGMDAFGDFELSTFASLVDERYSHERPTIVISTLEQSAFEGKCKGAVIDRAWQTGGIIGMGETSFRRSNKPPTNQ